MNNMRDDTGKLVPAVGAPGSVERTRCLYPRLISTLEWRKAKASRDPAKPFNRLTVDGMLATWAHGLEQQEVENIYTIMGV